jgi:hypothetical protein
MPRLRLHALVVGAATALAAAAAASSPPVVVSDCAVLIAGGSLSSLAAALTAANTTSSTVCYLEITDWPGGQLTASGVSAVDFDANRNPVDLPGAFRDMLFGGAISANNSCWVSTRCFEPQLAMSAWILPALRSFPNLRTYLGTAVVASTRDGATGAVTSVTAVQRTPVAGTTGWELPLSSTLADWYAPADSSRFTKQTFLFNGPVSDSAVWPVVEGTEFGDVLMTSGVRVGQGAETPLESSTAYQSYCGQGTTIPLYVSYAESVQPQPGPWPPGDGEGLPYTEANTSWARIWSYRRVKAVDNDDLDHAAPGEVSNQNWGGGNDLDNGYLFLPLEAALAQVDAGAWAGGVNLTALAMAEQRSWGWFQAYRSFADPAVRPYLTMNASQTGTLLGLSKMPYLRDARRSGMGVGGYRMAYADVSTPDPAAKNKTGVRFPDTIGLGSYFYADIHRMTPETCPYPPYLNSSITHPPVLPYYLPFRALTHADSPNLLVPGKAMSQSFWVNAATRLHPEEWVTGAAAGAAASLMVERGWTSTQDVLANVGELQAVLSSPRVDSPLTWTLP